MNQGYSLKLGEILALPELKEISGRKVRFLNHPNNSSRLDEAVSQCVSELRNIYPELGGDNGVLFSEVLRDRIAFMLKGGRSLEVHQGLVNFKPLAEDLSFFGQPWMTGKGFLMLLRAPMLNGGQPLALCPGTEDFKPLEKVARSWRSFSLAAESAMAVCIDARAGVDQLREMKAAVRPVEALPGGGFKEVVYGTGKS